MADVAVTNTFSANASISSSEVNTNFSDLVVFINNRNGGSATWDAVSIESASNVPLIANNSTGTQNIARFQDNGTNCLVIADGGASTFTATGAATIPVTINNSTSTGDILNCQDNGTEYFVVKNGGLAVAGPAASSVDTALSFETMGTYKDGQAGFAGSSIGDQSFLSLIRAETSHASPSAVAATAVMGNMAFRGYVGSTNKYVTGADISSTVIGVVSDAANGIGANIVFKTRTTGANLLERAQINQAGLMSVGSASSSVTAALSFETLGTYQDGQAGFTVSSIADTSFLSFLRAATSHASKAAITENDSLGSIAFRGYVGSTGGYVTAAQIDGTEIGSVTDASNGLGGFIGFKVRSSTANLLEKMRLDDLGNLGIGTTTFGSSAAGVLAIANGTQGSAAANMVQIVSEDLSAGNTQLSLRTEGGGAIGSGTPSQNRTLAIKVDGTQYYILASTSAS